MTLLTAQKFSDLPDCVRHTSNCCATPQATVHTTASVTQIVWQCLGCLK